MSNPTRRVLRLSSVVLERTKFYGGSYKLNKFGSFRLLKEIHSLVNLACMRIFITSVGQAIAEDTLPEKYIFIMSSTHHQRNSAIKINFWCKRKGDSVTSQRRQTCHQQELHREVWARWIPREDQDRLETSLCLCSKDHIWRWGGLIFFVSYWL